MRLLGLDVGDVMIGVAVSDPMRIIAQGLDSIKRVTPEKDVETIKRLVDEHEAGEIVVGLPKMMSGEIGIQAQKVLDFAELLKAAVEIPIVMWDERLSTVAATRSLIEGDMSRKKRKKVVDKVAAVLILQGYLDSHG
ncbi:Holliday junction resolvase RuvX [Candidatus Poribacteria bacterium]